MVIVGFKRIVRVDSVIIIAGVGFLGFVGGIRIDGRNVGKAPDAGASVAPLWREGEDEVLAFERVSGEQADFELEASGVGSLFSRDLIEDDCVVCIDGVGGCVDKGVDVVEDVGGDLWGVFDEGIEALGGRFAIERAAR